MWQTVSIRMSLLRNLVGVIILLAGGILITTIFGARSAVSEFSKSVINVSIELTENRLREFFGPVTQELLVIRQWGESGMLDRDDASALRQLLVPVLDQYAQVSGIIVADAAGREFMLLRTETGYASREVNVPEWGKRTRWYEWNDAAPTPAEFWRELDAYDPRERPWFKGAMARRSAALEHDPDSAPEELVHWTPPYTFFTLQKPGITTATTFEAEDGSTHVIALDIELSSISKYTESVHVTKHGGVIVLTQDWNVVGMPRAEHFEQGAPIERALLRQPEDIGSQLVVEVARAFRPGMRAAKREPVAFTSGGETWWGGAKVFELGPDQELLVGVAVPERDMITNLWTLRFWIIGVTTVVLVAAMVRAIVLARWFSKPIEQLVKQSDDISRGDLDEHEPIESRVVEVQALASAQDHMRSALRSLLKMERDMQLARQIQQRTFPSRLPSMHGYEIAAAAEPADETGGDTYDVIGFAPSSAAEMKTTGDAVKLTDDNPRHVALVLADATGHGIGPALAASQFRSMVRMAIRMGRELGEIAHHVNDQLCSDLPSGRFVTAWMATLDREKHILHSFSAGHAPLFHYVAASDAFEVLEADTMPFGITRSLPIEPAKAIPLARGDFFLVVSDGILEMMNPAREQYGQERFLALVRRERQGTPQQLIDAFRVELASFTQGLHPADDCTAVILKRVS